MPVYSGLAGAVVEVDVLVVVVVVIGGEADSVVVVVGEEEVVVVVGEVVVVVVGAVVVVVLLVVVVVASMPVEMPERVAPLLLTRRGVAVMQSSMAATASMDVTFTVMLLLSRIVTAPTSQGSTHFVKRAFWTALLKPSRLARAVRFTGRAKLICTGVTTLSAMQGTMRTQFLAPERDWQSQAVLQTPLLQGLTRLQSQVPASPHLGKRTPTGASVKK